MINPMDLTGKRILVTGATGGMGRETSLLLSRLGARVVLCDMNEENLKNLMTELEGDGHSYRVLNLNDIDSIEGLVADLVNEGGPFNGFAHCAGIAQARPLKMTKTSDIINQMNPNLFSFIEIVRCLSIKGRIAYE